jgi:glucokinase
MEHYAIGIDLGGTSIKAALVERNAGLVVATRTPTETERGADHVLDRIVEVVEEIFEEAPGKHVDGIGIGAPGTIDWDRKCLIYPPNIPGWQTIDLSAVLQERLQKKLHVVVENDANAAALGSAHYGTGRPHDAFIMITLGTGVGGAIIYQNTIFRGTTGGAGEIGHMTIDYEGPLARSGVAGAIEAYLGQRFLSRHARYRLLNYPESPLHQDAGPDMKDLTPEMLSQAAAGGDAGAREVLAWAGHKLGCVLGAAINLLDIRTVIVGGGVSAAGDLILDPARRTVGHYIKPGLREGVVILQETLGNEVGMLGAAYLVFELLDTHVPTPEQP